MAKNYQEIIESVYTTGNKMDFSNSIIRGNGIPLDITEVYNSYKPALEYALNSPVAYEGQIIAVTENNKSTAYIITPNQFYDRVIVEEDLIECTAADFSTIVGNGDTGDRYKVTEEFTTTSDFLLGSGFTCPAGTIIFCADTNQVDEYGTAIYALIINAPHILNPIGIIPSGDSATVEVTEDGVISIRDFNKRYYKYIEATEEESAYYELTEGWPTDYKNLEAKAVYDKTDRKWVIGWFEPNSTTVEGLASQIASLNEEVGDAETEEGPTGLYKYVNDKIGAPATKDGETTTPASGIYELVYTKTETDTKIAEEISKAGHLNKLIVNQKDVNQETGEITLAIDGEEVTEAKYPNTIFLFKVEDAFYDQYEEYTYIGGKITLIGSTGTDLTDLEALREEVGSSDDMPGEGTIWGIVNTVGINDNPQVSGLKLWNLIWGETETPEADLPYVPGVIPTLAQLVRTVGNSTDSYDDGANTLYSKLKRLEDAIEYSDDVEVATASIELDGVETNVARLEIKQVNVNKLVQTYGDILILDGGTANGVYAPDAITN